jgi:tetratricopeptide (TPR) repeat protein
LEAAEAVCDRRLASELKGRLAEYLTDRGVKAANEEPSRWQDAVTDLRRAVQYNPHIPRPISSLGIALRLWSQERRFFGAPDQARELLEEAVERLEGGLERMPGHREISEQYRLAQEELGKLLNSFAVSQANMLQFDLALETLRQARRRLPEDATLRLNERNIYLAHAGYLAGMGEMARAIQVLQEATARFPDDQGLARELAQALLLQLMMESRRW